MESENEANEYENDSDSSNESFFSASEDLSPYDDSVEPLASLEEVTEYERTVAEEEEDENMLLSRYAGETDVKDWCKCGCCSLEYVVKPEECRCCLEVDRCVAKMEDIDMFGECITEHSGFNSVCLDEWVLDTAAVGLKTRKKKSYSSNRGDATDAQYFRSISYRQFVRFVWEYVGANKRLPLPCCVYQKIRMKFPSEDNSYRGYSSEETEEDTDHSQNNNQEAEEDVSEEEMDVQ